MLAAESEELPPFRRFMDDRRYFEAPGRFPIEGAFIEGWGLYAEYLGEASDGKTTTHSSTHPLSHPLTHPNTHPPTDPPMRNALQHTRLLLGLISG